MNSLAADREHFDSSAEILRRYGKQAFRRIFAYELPRTQTPALIAENDAGADRCEHPRRKSELRDHSPQGDPRFARLCR